METVMAYKTNDGKLFGTRQEAIAHEVVYTSETRIDKFVRDNGLEHLEGIKSVLSAWEAFNQHEQKNRSINSFSFNVRTLNCLLAERISTVADLLQYSEHDLLRTPNLGRKSLDEIKEVLLGNGWQLSATSKYSKE